jgi:tetratricopeptide (TPR) repeat protein
MQILSTFEKQVKNALKWFDDPEQLGKESPLASPYFLSRTIDDQLEATSARVRGEALRRALRTAAATLWGGPLPRNAAEMRQAIPEIRQQPGTRRYSYLVIELRAFQDYLRPRRTADIWESEAYLPGSRAEHYRDFDVAVQHLGEALLHYLHPTLRPEHPPQSATVGYEAARQEALRTLRAGNSVSLSGPGGVGKTALGAELFKALSEEGPVFWYTIRSTFNDRLNSLLFALGHFLQIQGVTNLWQLLVAAGGLVHDNHLALAMIRQDLEEMRPRLPLLCFDELDLIAAVDAETALPAHSQMLALIDGLRQQTPLLMIGQRPTLEADLHLELTGLATPQIYELLHQRQINLAPEEVEQLYRYSHGNPRLLLLCLALHERGETLAETLAALPTSPGLIAILRRLWVRLEPEERRMLQRLSVLRNPAPLRAWPEAAALLQSLAQRRLVMADGLGGVELHSALRAPIYAELAADLRDALHMEAAHMRLAHGEYTAAAHHFNQAHRPSEAIHCWYARRSHEIQRGQAEAALAIFGEISRRGLGKSERQALALILAELYKLAGDLEAGRARLQEEDWQGESEMNTRANALRAEFAEALGYPDSALQTYGDAILTTSRLLGQLVHLRRQRSMLYLRQKQRDDAWREAQLAECQLHNLRGELQEEDGRYAEALASYEEGLKLALALKDTASLALTEGNLASLYGRKQDLERAVEFAQSAITRCREIGDVYSMAKLTMNLSYIYIQTQQFVQAVETAKTALRTFKAIGSPYYSAISAVNLAEAYFESGELEKAEETAYEALDLEEAQTMPYALFTLGQVRRRRGEWASAAQHLLESARLARMNQDHYMEAYAQRTLGEILAEQEQKAEAKAILEQALALFRQLEIDDEVRRTEERLLALA